MIRRAASAPVRYPAHRAEGRRLRHEAESTHAHEPVQRVTGVAEWPFTPTSTSRRLRRLRLAPSISDDDLLAKLLELNLSRAGTASASTAAEEDE